MNSTKEAVVLVLAMGAVILFTRALPFLFGKLKRSGSSRLTDFVEKTVPPAAMTVLAFNILGSSVKNDSVDGLLALAASAFTALVHLWKRNTLLSILGGTAVYMLLQRIVMG